MTKVDLKKQANIREIILATLVLISLFFVFLRMVSGPRSEQIQSLKDEINQLKQEEEALTLETQVLSQGRQTEKADTAASPNVKLKILTGKIDPVADHMPAFLLQVTSPHFKQGVIIDSLASGESQERGRYSMTPLSLKAHGPFSRLIDYLDRLDTIVSLVSVDAVRLLMDPMIAGTMNLELSASFYKVEGIHAKSLPQ